MGLTTIQWTDFTFNPWHGCTKVSSECDNCYAETLVKRYGYSETGSKFPIWGKDADRRWFGDKHWAEPLKWDRAAAKEGTRKRVFCGSLCDVMEDYNGNGYLTRETMEESRRWLYDLIERTPNLDWQLLTKRPQNFARFLPQSWLNNPRPNVWLMTTVGTQETLWRVDALKRCPAVVHGLSVEPLLEDLPTLGERLDDIELVIVGGESGPGARPLNMEWLRNIIDQCEATDTLCFVKQLGARPYSLVKDDFFRYWALDDGPNAFHKGPFTARFSNKKAGDPDEWPKDVRVREMPSLTKSTTAVS